MADDVNALGTTPVGTDPVNIPAHIQALKDSINGGSILRRLTQAQIDALPAAQKPIGVTVHNLTAQRDERWNGAAWVPTDGSDRLPAAGGTVAGDVTFDVASGDRALVFSKSGVLRWRIIFNSNTGDIGIQRRNASTGAYVDDPLVVRAATGRVETSSHIAGTHAGTTNLAGYTNMTIGASPSGTWNVVCNAQIASSGVPVACIGVQTAPTTITFTVPNASTAVNIVWHAIAV